MCNKMKYLHAAIDLQEPARLLQHLFYFIAHETTSLLNTQRIAVQHWNKILNEKHKTIYNPN